MIVRRDRHDRHLLVDERDRTVLHLAGRVALGVDVGDLLQLERALERDRIVDPAAEIEEVAALIEAPRDLLGAGLALERLLEQQRQLRQGVEVRPRGVGRERAANLAEVDRQEVQRHELRRERLRRGDADLGAGVRVDRAVGLARRHAADDVADGDAVGALLPGFAQRGERVGGFA